VSAANAHWSLVNDTSSLSFVTVKAEHVAEAHTFDVLSGTIGDAGEVEINIELASVNTMIEIRNERMQAMLFETNMFPDATITATVDLEAITAMDAGASSSIQLDFELSLHGTTMALSADVMLTRLEHGVVATTLKPIIVAADSFGLVAGVEALREVAGLSSISRSVPVSFTVVFEQGH
jgi:polyisoprenoid-binding protein YceI